MKRKIIAIGIIGMFLLTSVAGLSAVGIKVETSEKDVTNFDNLPDLTLEITKISPQSIKGCWEVDMKICNEGTATAVFSEETLLMYIAYYNGHVLFWGWFPDAPPLKPGDVITGHYHPYFDECGNGGGEITIAVDYLFEKPSGQPDHWWPDPDPEYGYIDEIDDIENNVDTAVLPKARPREFNSPIFSLLSRFPIFQRILEKLSLF